MRERKPCSFDGCKNTAAGRYCSTHYRHLQTTGALRPVAGHSPRPTTCAVDGCEKQRKPRRTICSMHVARVGRHGDVDAVHIPTAMPRRVTSHGYVTVRAVGHPLANRHGLVYEHRKVLFDSIGAGTHSCAWCRKPIAWTPTDDVARLEVDHFNADRQDNHPANLLPCCRQCNTMRVDPYEEHRDGTPRRRSA